MTAIEDAYIEANRILASQREQSQEEIIGELCVLLSCEPGEIVARVREWEHDRAAIIREFVSGVNAAAEADMLAGNPIEGAHHRALDAALRGLEEVSEDAGSNS